MAKTIGARDRSKGRTRDETEDQISKRVAKTAETKKANKRKKHDDERAATAHRKSGFFEKRVRKSADQPIDGDDANDIGAGDDSNDDDLPMPDQEANHADDEGSDAGEDGELTAEEMLATFTATGDGVDAHVPPDVAANYDVADEGSGDIDEEGGGGGGDRGPDTAAPAGLMGAYIYHIHERLKYELGNKIKAFEEKWLLNLLRKKENRWWIRNGHAEFICSKIPDLEYGEQSYYRDIRVWLPDQEYGAHCMPFCGTCKSNENVGPHCFRDNHFSRTVIGLKQNYYLISRRYICHQCTRDADALKKRLEEEAAKGQLQVLVEKPPAKTFMGWNAASNNLLPYGKGDEFPAFLTWRAAVDKGLIDLMRPLFDFGVRPEQFSNLVLEQHAKEYSRQYLKYERKLEEGSFQGKKPQMYSDFADKEKYAGIVPTGNYFALVYKRYHKTIRTFLSKEVKKRDSRQLSWDVSYKVNKKMCQYHGQAVSCMVVTHSFSYMYLRCCQHAVSLHAAHAKYRYLRAS